MAEEERELFRSSSLTARKQHASTQSESELKTSTKKSIRRFNSKKSLFNISTELLNTTTMNFFQQKQDENWRFQKFQKNLKSKSFSSEIIFQP